MKTSGNTILITGGATGIGFALAEQFVKNDNEVIIVGRREYKLKEAKQKLPSLHIKVCDLSNRSGRQQLCEWITLNFKAINVLVNNAGVQRIINFKKGISELLNDEDELSINLIAPIEMSANFIPLFMNKSEAAIINVSSGLGLAPLALFPVYCASKAAIHSFSMTLRHQLKNTPIKVFEIIAPTTDTELDKGMRAKRGADNGISADEVAKAAFEAIRTDEFEIAIGQAKDLLTNSRNNPQQLFDRMNQKIKM